MNVLAKPPYGNTGAQNTEQYQLISLIDWISATFPDDTPLESIFHILGIEKSMFIQMKTGLHGYKNHLKFGHISVLYDGSKGMGTHIEMTGQGCREYETLRPNNWHDFFHMVMKFGHFTRVDAAIDDFIGYFKISQLVWRIRNNLTTSKFKKAIRIEGIKIEDGSTTGETLYFGSPTSRIKIRFYDKYLERQAAGKEIEEGLTFWNRTEVEMRDERAQIFIAHLLAGEELGTMISGVLKNYITFREKSNETNKARYPVAEFWNEFLGDVEKIKLTQIAPDRTIEKSHEWIARQVSPSLGMLTLAYDGSTDWLHHFVNEGVQRLSEKEYAMIRAYKELQNKKPINQQCD